MLLLWNAILAEVASLLSPTWRSLSGSRCNPAGCFASPVCDGEHFLHLFFLITKLNARLQRRPWPGGYPRTALVKRTRPPEEPQVGVGESCREVVTVLVCSDRARPCALPQHLEYSFCRMWPLQQARDGGAAVLFIILLGENAFKREEMEFVCCGVKKAWACTSCLSPVVGFMSVFSHLSAVHPYVLSPTAVSLPHNDRQWLPEDQSSLSFWWAGGVWGEHEPQQLSLISFPDSKLWSVDWRISGGCHHFGLF